MPRILIIDPERDSLEALKRALAEAGFTDVIAVHSGSFALTMIERDRPDLIVSHAGVPDINGFELCSIVRSDAALGNVLFVLLVGADVDVPDGALETGPDRCLVGEFNAETIVAEVSSLLSRVSTPTSPAVVEPGEPAPAPGALHGSLGVMDLPDVAQAIALAAKTGRLSLATAAGAATVVFERGRVVHAEFGALTGERAFAALVAAAHADPAGTFCFSPLEQIGSTATRSMNRTIEQLLLSAASEIDEARVTGR